MAVIGVGVLFRKPLVIAAHVEGGMDGVMGHVQVERLVRLPGVFPNGVQAFQRLLRQGFRQECVVFIVIIFIQSADMEIPRAVFPGTPVVRRAAYFRAGDIVVKAEEPGIGSGRIFGAEMSFSAVDGGITLFLSRAGSPSTWVKGFSILYWIFLPSGEDGWFRTPWFLSAGCR